ncbi:hypothetical protein MTR67_026649 [Solanum verrucosum]|uniref:Uncharacterized protein n=1 Tax=Solanum verrucosum TaxID=315347 RepID=A0AAF0TV04_SOLVR|nr:hypothetical protein MTR67_026649 [Solanum verrucosum]
MTIQYHPGNANVVGDALSQKTVSMGSLACLGVSKQPLAKEIQTLELGISEKGGVLASVEVRATFIEEIKTKQFEDEHLKELRNKIVSGNAQETTLDAGGVLSFKGSICVPRISLPKTLGKFDSIWLVVDRLTKLAHFIPVRIDYNAQQLAKVYVKEIDELGTHLTFSTTFHPQTDEQSKRTIQVLEDMLRSCVIGFGGHWDKFLPLCEFSYNNSYRSSIDMAPFEAFYLRKCRAPIGWFEYRDVKPLVVDLVKDAQDKVRSSQAKLLAAQSRQKKYAGHKVREMAF